MNKIITAIFLCTLFLPCIVSAEIVGADGKSGSNKPVTIDNPIKTSDPNAIIGMAISAILSLVGAVALLMIVYGGVLWMFAAGNKENITKGKDIIMWTALGMLLIFSSYAIIKFILSALTGKTG